MSCCSALELRGSGVAGWVFLGERRAQEGRMEVHSFIHQDQLP